MQKTLFFQSNQVNESQQRQSIARQQCDIEEKLADTMRSANEADIAVMYFGDFPLTTLYINPDHIFFGFNRYELRGKEELPSGLVPFDEMGTYYTILERTVRLHEMLKAGIPITIFCESLQRNKANELEGFVDDTQLKRLQNRYANLRIIPLPQNTNFSNLRGAAYFNNGQVINVNDNQITNNVNLEFKRFCEDLGVDCPLTPVDRRVYLHSIYHDTWNERSHWKTLLYVSKKALEKSNVFSEDIYNNMSAAAFYLGRYQEAEEYATIAGNSSEYLHPDAVCRALYLRSAACRANDFFNDAALYATRSLEIYEKHHLSDQRLLAKINFNLLAAHMDNPDSTYPVHSIRVLSIRTIELFKIKHDDIEADRVRIRMANYYLKNHDRPDIAHTYLNEVCDEVRQGNSRVSGHYELARGRLLVALKDVCGAEAAFVRSMEIAEALGATADYKRAKTEKDKLKEEPIESVRRMFSVM